MSSFHTTNHLSNAFGFLANQRGLTIEKRTAISAIPPSSITTKAEESGNLPDSTKRSHPNGTQVEGSHGGSLLMRCSTVGIMGGASIESTLKFVNKLVKWSLKDDKTSIPFVLSSDPMLSRDLLHYESGHFPVLGGKTKHIARDHNLIVSSLQSKRHFLEKSVAHCIVMPCNILHWWYDEVAEGCSVPILHVGECIAKELKEAKFKPLEAGSPLRIGVLGTSGTLEAGFYQEKLENEGFEVVVPDKATMEHTVLPAVEALSRKDVKGAQNLFRIALQVLLVRAVNTVILASDVMCDILPMNDPLMKRCIDPMDALARSTIQCSQSANLGA